MSSRVSTQQVLFIDRKEGLWATSWLCSMLFVDPYLKHSTPTGIYYSLRKVTRAYSLLPACQVTLRKTADVSGRFYNFSCRRSPSISKIISRFLVGRSAFRSCRIQVPTIPAAKKAFEIPVQAHFITFVEKWQAAKLTLILELLVKFEV